MELLLVINLELLLLLRFLCHPSSGSHQSEILDFCHRPPIPTIFIHASFSETWIIISFIIVSGANCDDGEGNDKLWQIHFLGSSPNYFPSCSRPTYLPYKLYIPTHEVMTSLIFEALNWVGWLSDSYFRRCTGCTHCPLCSFDLINDKCRRQWKTFCGWTEKMYLWQTDNISGKTPLRRKHRPALKQKLSRKQKKIKKNRILKKFRCSF